MNTMETYLLGLRDRVFKLLPMREAMDRGEENFLEDYLINLCASFDGAMECYPMLANERELAEVWANVTYLRSNLNLDFARWRSMILRSTRLVGAVIARREQEV